MRYSVIRRILSTALFSMMVVMLIVEVTQILKGDKTIERIDAERNGRLIAVAQNRILRAQVKTLKRELTRVNSLNEGRNLKVRDLEKKLAQANETLQIANAATSRLEAELCTRNAEFRDSREREFSLRDEVERADARNTSCEKRLQRAFARARAAEKRIRRIRRNMLRVLAD